MSTPLFHLAQREIWESAEATGTYTMSTLDRTLEQEGFIHASRADQWPRIRAAFFAHIDTDLVLVTIDPDLLEVPVVEEIGNPETGELFAHIYGPLPMTAVVATQVLHPPHGGTTPPNGTD